MTNSLTTEFKEYIFNTVKATKYAQIIIEALDTDNLTSLRVVLGDYLEDITPEIRPLFTSENVMEWNDEVTKYQKVYGIYNIVLTKIEETTQEKVKTENESRKA